MVAHGVSRPCSSVHSVCSMVRKRPSWGTARFENIAPQVLKSGFLVHFNSAITPPRSLSNEFGHLLGQLPHLHVVSGGIRRTLDKCHQPLTSFHWGNAANTLGLNARFCPREKVGVLLHVQ